MGSKESSWNRRQLRVERMENRHWQIVRDTDPRSGPSEAIYRDPGEAPLHDFLFHTFRTVESDGTKKFLVAAPRSDMSQQEYDTHTAFFQRASAPRWTVTEVIMSNGDPGWQFSLI